MSVEYIVVPYKIPSRPEDPVTYYPRLQAVGEINIREIAKEISSISTVSSVDTIAVLEGLLEIIPKHISNGEIVKLGELGSFFLTIKAEGSLTPEEVSPQKIKSNKLHFRPGKLIKKALNEVKYHKRKR